MSSHHIVREGQEPALVVANGLACSDELLGQLLEWSPFVLALDGALQRLIDKGIKVDAVIGDFDSSNISTLNAMPYPVEIIHAHDQQHTDLEKGLQYLISKKYSAANIIWATGKRADHTLANISVLARFHKEITLNIIDDYSRVFHAGKHFRKYYPEGTQLSLMPLGKAEGVVTENLLYPLIHEDLVLGHRNGNSNQVQTTGWVDITCVKGDLLIMECRDIADVY